MPSHKIKIHSLASILPSSLETEADDNVLDILKDRKQNKLLSKQDKLGLKAAHLAWKKAKIFENDKDYSENTGIYFCVGTLPFEDRPLERLAAASQIGGELDYHKFSTDGFNSMNPMLTFKALPNMPLFHISYNLGITGRYFMTYPGVLDWFSALKRAIADLNDGLIKYAIVGASCDQKNFLVSHHIKRTQPEYLQTAVDCASAIVISKEDLPFCAEIEDIDVRYQAYDPFHEKIILTQDNPLAFFCGPVTPLCYLSQRLEAGDTAIKYQWYGSQDQQASFIVRSHDAR